MYRRNAVPAENTERIVIGPISSEDAKRIFYSKSESNQSQFSDISKAASFREQKIYFKANWTSVKWTFRWEIKRNSEMNCEA